MDTRLLELLVCPVTKGRLEFDREKQELISRSARLAYPVRDGIPILLEETDKIMKAQIARGADFENGSLIQRAKAMVPLLVPLFIAAFRRANDLAMAMEARCYRGGEGRTKMKPLVYRKQDYMGYGVLVAYLVAAVLIGRVLL